MEKKREITRNTRVDVVNKMPWSVSFHSDVTRTDYTIPASEKPFKLLTVEVVEHEILTGNIAFVGVDEVGSHSAFKIVDADIYKYLFDVDEPQKPYDFMEIENLIDTCDDKMVYSEEIEKLIVTPSEAKATLYYMDSINFEDMVAWKESILVHRCKSLM